VYTYTFGIQRSLNRNYTLEVNYIGDRSDNLAGNRDVNAIDPNNPLENGIGAGSCVHQRPVEQRRVQLQRPANDAESAGLSWARLCGGLHL
jgi:hypothetical protein